MYTEIERCRICGNTRLVPVLDLGPMALTGIFPRRSEESVPSGPLQLVKCHPERDHADSSCGLVQLRHSFDPEQMYRSDYGYRSGLNPSMVRHLQRKVAGILSCLRLRPGDLVLDIGSNDGTLLKSYPDLGLTRAGIDPTGHRFGKYYPPEIDLIPEFFSAELIRKHYGERKARVVTSIAMFYDLEAPLAFTQQVSGLLADDGIWVFEQSYLPTMVEMNSYDTVCHEHIEFYTLRQIKWLMDRAGLKIVDVEFNDVNGGSFSVTAAHRHSPHPEATVLIESLLEKEVTEGFDDLAVYEELSRRVLEHAHELRELVRSLRSRGKRILGYGASTKGNVILQYCGFTEQDIPAIAEINEDKFGSRTPGTSIPIVSEEQARRMKPDYFLVLPWHFRESIIRREQGFLRQGGGLIVPLPKVEILKL